MYFYFCINQYGPNGVLFNNFQLDPDCETASSNADSGRGTSEEGDSKLTGVDSPSSKLGIHFN